MIGRQWNSARPFTIVRTESHPEIRCRATQDGDAQKRTQYQEREVTYNPNTGLLSQSRSEAKHFERSEDYDSNVEY